MQQHASLEEVKSHFDYWRATRTKRGKIPASLWDKVKPLLDLYPLSAITNTLSINTNQIRENLEIDPTKINFVEVKTDSLTTTKQPIIALCENTQTCSIELHRINGVVLKVSAIPIASLPSIITQFMV